MKRKEVEDWKLKMAGHVKEILSPEFEAQAS